jgi:hypothetical protein
VGLTSQAISLRESHRKLCFAKLHRNRIIERGPELPMLAVVAEEKILRAKSANYSPINEDVVTKTCQNMRTSGTEQTQLTRTMSNYLRRISTPNTLIKTANSEIRLTALNKDRSYTLRINNSRNFTQQ